MRIIQYLEYTLPGRGLFFNLEVSSLQYVRGIWAQRHEEFQDTSYEEVAKRSFETRR